MTLKSALFAAVAALPMLGVNLANAERAEPGIVQNEAIAGLGAIFQGMMENMWDGVGPPAFDRDSRMIPAPDMSESDWQTFQTLDSLRESYFHDMISITPEIYKELYGPDPVSGLIDICTSLAAASFYDSYLKKFETFLSDHPDAAQWVDPQELQRAADLIGQLNRTNEKNWENSGDKRQPFCKQQISQFRTGLIRTL